MNIPNFITLGRVILVPVVFWLLVSGQTEMAFVVFVVAGISDAVDGFLAKRFGWATELGAYLDPLADKLLIVSIYIALAVAREIPSWLVIAVVSRDVLILLAVMISWLMDQPVRIKPLADAMEIAIAPFPPRATTSVDAYGEAILYLVQGGGAEVGRALAGKFGKDTGALYDAAIKSNLLLLLYEPGDDHGLGDVIKARMSEAGVPEQFWIGVIDAIDKKASQSALKDAVLKMHEAVASYLAAATE